jgi:two-component system alkaline phosphatase synthesis response regulator PhoP
MLAAHGGPPPRGTSGRREPLPATRPVEPRTTTRRVLLVDDDPALRLLYRFNLEASGVDVVEAPDGESALQLLESELPDVVLLDVMMPGLDGWAVAERLAGDPRTASLPVIFITARAEDEARARGLELGAAAYLVKPFNPALLAERIDRALAAADADDTQAR